MKATLEYKEALDSINVSIVRMKKTVNESEDGVLNACGMAIMGALPRFVPRSSEEYLKKNYDGSTPYVHIIDDVRSRIRKNKQTGAKYVSVGGGKYTGYKWNWLDRGWTDHKGVFHSGTNFMEKTVQLATQAINKYMDGLCNEVVKDD